MPNYAVNTHTFDFEAYTSDSKNLYKFIVTPNGDDAVPYLIADTEVKLKRYTEGQPAVEYLQVTEKSENDNLSFVDDEKVTDKDHLRISRYDTSVIKETSLSATSDALALVVGTDDLRYGEFKGAAAKFFDLATSSSEDVWIGSDDNKIKFYKKI